MFVWQHPRLKVVCKLVCRDKRFNMMCHMPIFQGMGDSSKKCDNPKEETGKASANVGMASRLPQINFSTFFKNPNLSF